MLVPIISIIVCICKAKTLHRLCFKFAQFFFLFFSVCFIFSLRSELSWLPSETHTSKHTHTHTSCQSSRGQQDWHTAVNSQPPEGTVCLLPLWSHGINIFSGRDDRSRPSLFGAAPYHKVVEEWIPTHPLILSVKTHPWSDVPRHSENCCYSTNAWFNIFFFIAIHAFTLCYLSQTGPNSHTQQYIAVIFFLFFRVLLFQPNTASYHTEARLFLVLGLSC